MVQGRWIITVKTPMGDKEGILELECDGCALTGTMSHGEHRVAISDGRVDGGKLSWSAKLTQPLRMMLKFTATVQADRIDGAAKHLLGRVTFAGRRA